MFFVLFKQKTAYELRISDWSSDVCSSDLRTRGHVRPGFAAEHFRRRVQVSDVALQGERDQRGGDAGGDEQREDQQEAAFAGRVHWNLNRDSGARPLRGGLACGSRAGRSEEHTSELQSLMRNSYAVFCLKKKNN